ncbi:MAG: aldehyde dehydrogenase family protein [Pseudomonadota bacterium]
MDWQTAASTVNFQTRPFINGDWFLQGAIAAGAAFDTCNPANGEGLARFSGADETTVAAAVVAARDGFKGWSRRSPLDRKAKLLAWAERVRMNKATIALLDSLEMGKPITSALGEVDAAADFIQYYAELADKTTGEMAPIEVAHGLSMTYPEPRGVVGVITPWNFPTLTAVSAIAPALAAGNAVVQKPSEYSPSSALKMAELAVEAGIPQGVLNVIPGPGAIAGAALALHADVDKLHFTGSTGVGKQLMIYAGQSNGKPVMLETGGKSPQIVFADALDIEDIELSLAADVFSNSGQICVSRTRLLVEHDIAEALTDRLLARTRDVFRAGNPLDTAVNFGPIASVAQHERVQSYISVALEQGGRCRPASLAGELPGQGFFVAPTVVDEVDTGSRVWREEIFGPVLSVMPFRSYEEAVALANDTSYGLAATAWTRDLGRARRLSHDIEAGRIDIRSGNAPGQSLAHLSAEPFGASGHGVLGGKRGLEPYLRYKGVQFLTG